jgi:hypothetical protein
MHEDRMIGDASAMEGVASRCLAVREHRLQI